MEAVMSRIKGIEIKLIKKVEMGTDEFNRPIYEEVEKIVKNVLVSPVLSDDVVNKLNLSGKKAVYQLGIPKGDENTWENQEVEFFGERFRVSGKIIQGIEENIPLDWNRKVTVECIE